MLNNLPNFKIGPVTVSKPDLGSLRIFLPEKEIKLKKKFGGNFFAHVNARMQVHALHAHLKKKKI